MNRRLFSGIMTGSAVLNRNEDLNNRRPSGADATVEAGRTREGLVAVIVASVAALTLSCSTVLAAGIPFTENFNSYNITANPSVVPTGFTEVNSARWSVRKDGSGNDYEHVKTDLNDTPSTLNVSYEFSYVTITNLNGRDFVLSAQMTVESAAITGNGGNNVTAGLTFLCSSSGWVEGYKASVVLVGDGAGQLSIQENGGVLATNLFPGTITAGTIYNLEVQGRYNGPSSLTITFSMSDGTSTGMVSYTDSSPLSGQTFGFEDTLLTFPKGTSASIRVHYDDFSLVQAPPQSNRAPTAIALSNSTVPENEPSGTTVGELSTSDPDAANTFTYTLVGGAGSTDNGSFAINGSTLRTAASLNYEDKSSYTVRVRTTDQGGLWCEQAFTTTVSNVNEPAPAFAVPQVDTGGAVVLRWPSISNHRYTLYQSTNLLSGFSVLQSNLLAYPPMNTYTDTVQGVSRKFWRVSTGN